MTNTNKKTFATRALLVGLTFVASMLLAQPAQAAFEDLYAKYNTIDTGTWNRLEDIKASLGNPTFEGNDGTHYYIYEPMPRALKITNHVLVNTDGYWGSHYVPNYAIVLSGYRVTIRLNNYYTDVTKDTNGWNSFEDMRSALGDPSYINTENGRHYYVYYNLPSSIRVSDKVRVNTWGREGSNYVPNGDVVSKGQRATIRFNYDVVSDSSINASSLGNDDELRKIARDGNLSTLEYGGRVFTPTRNIYIDTDSVMFDTPNGRMYKGATVFAGRQVTLWRR